MFKNPGSKIKTYTMVVFILEITIVVLGGILVLLIGASEGIDNPAAIIIGALATIMLGIVFSWISCVFMYGYGEQVEKTTKIEKELNALLISQGIRTIRTSEDDEEDDDDYDDEE